MIFMNEYQLNRLKIVYGIALSIIAITIISSSCLMLYTIKRNGGESRVINLSGRQRMFSQRITKCVLALERSSSPAERSLRSAELVESFSAWKTAHAGLQFGDEKLGLPRRENSPEIKKLFAEIAPFHSEMVRAIDSLLVSMEGNHTNPALLSKTSDLLLVNEPHFLSLMDKLTFQFDREARERVNSMLFLEKIILLVGLPPGDYIRIAVEDRGYGITQENLVKIFDPYFTTKSKGSGLGLASVYSIVKRHGGAIEVSSTPGEGSTFTVHLPATPSRLPEDPCTNEYGELKGSGKVLVMDDEELIREIATHILGFMGYEVDSCADGREAVERFRAERENNMPFAAVILDLTIPGGMGGKEAAARILEIDPDAVLIVSSGYSSDPILANFRQYGFSGVVPKPFDAEGLANELKRLIPNIC
jgi:CheY-like chemotaxis protein